MAVECIVLSGSLANTLNGTTDFTQTDFGTPTAAIVVNTSAHPITNPVSLNTTNIGFWDGTTQTAASTTSINDQSTSKTHRSFEAGSISLIQSGDEIFYAKYSIENITDGVRITCDVDNTSTERYATVILFKGTTNAYVGVQDLGTGTSAVDVTAPSFKPSIVFFAGVGAAIGTAASNAILSLGVAHNNSSDVISQGYISVSDSDGKSTANSNSYASDSSIANQQHTDTLTYEVTISAFDSSGFSLTSTVSAANDDLSYLAIELPNADDAWVGQLTAALSTGDDVVTGVGFTPQVVGFLSENNTTFDAIQQGNSLLASFNDDTISGTYTTRAKDNVGTTEVRSEYFSDRALQLVNHAGTVDGIASLSSMDSDGFTLNYSDAASSATNILAFAIGDSSAAPADDVLYQNMIHQIESGLITQTASGLNGVLVT